MQESSINAFPTLAAGVDTHMDTHTLAILSRQGQVISTATFPTNRQGYINLINHLKEAGEVPIVGVEGTNSYGAGLTRALRGAGYEVKEVLRPTRQVRRLHGKSDPLDAVEAARSLLSNHGISEAKDSSTPAESLRCLLLSRVQLVRMATNMINTITALLVTAPEEVRAKYRNLSPKKLAEHLAASRPKQEPLDTPEIAVMHALRHLAKVRLDVQERALQLEMQMHEILQQHYPQILNIYGVGTIVATQLVVTIGGNPERVRNEAAFASLCGVAPIPASSGRTTRHRLNRGGDRRGNAALHRIALNRLYRDPRTKDYAERRKQEGKSKREIMRCLKRAIAREVFRVLTNKNQEAAPRPDLKAIRESKNLTQTQVAKALNTYPSRISEIERNRSRQLELTNRYQKWLDTI